MKKVDKKYKLIDEDMILTLEKYRVKDITDDDRINLEGYEMYADRNIRNLLELIKIERMYENKIINDKEKNSLIDRLNKYYDNKDRVSEIVYTCLISDMDECNDIVNHYYEEIGYLYKDIDNYGIFLDVGDANIFNRLINNIDKSINKKKKLGCK